MGVAHDGECASDPLHAMDARGVRIVRDRRGGLGQSPLHDDRWCSCEGSDRGVFARRSSARTRAVPNCVARTRRNGLRRDRRHLLNGTPASPRAGAPASVRLRCGLPDNDCAVGSATAPPHGCSTPDQRGRVLPIRGPVRRRRDLRALPPSCLRGSEFRPVWLRRIHLWVRGTLTRREERGVRRDVWGRVHPGDVAATGPCSLFLSFYWDGMAASGSPAVVRRDHCDQIIPIWSPARALVGCDRLPGGVCRASPGSRAAPTSGATTLAEHVRRGGCDRPCQPRPQRVLEFAPVCGCDGTIHDNECFAQMAASTSGPPALPGALRIREADPRAPATPQRARESPSTTAAAVAFARGVTAFPRRTRLPRPALRLPRRAPAPGSGPRRLSRCQAHIRRLLGARLGSFGSSTTWRRTAAIDTARATRSDAAYGRS